jgi:hypothetical protein
MTPKEAAMDARTLIAAAMLAAVFPAAARAGDEPQGRQSTPAEEGVQQGSGTAANAATAPTGDAAGTTIGSGSDTTGTPGLAVGEGTVMRPLSAEGRNGLKPAQAPRRKQLYGLNPKADDTPRKRDAPH